MSQMIVTVGIVAFVLFCSFGVYGILKKFFGIRLDKHQEVRGSDLTIHSIESHPEEAL